MDMRRHRSRLPDKKDTRPVRSKTRITVTRLYQPSVEAQATALQRLLESCSRYNDDADAACLLADRSPDAIEKF